MENGTETESGNGIKFIVGSNSDVVLEIVHRNGIVNVIGRKIDIKMEEFLLLATRGTRRYHDKRYTGVTMARSDKHCQTSNTRIDKINSYASLPNEYSKSILMYDETVNVVNAKEIDSPDSDERNTPVLAAMSKFNPPVRHTAKRDFDTDSETTDSEADKFLNNNTSGEDQSPDRRSLDKADRLKDAPKVSETKQAKTKPSESSENSESDSSDIEADGVEFPASGRRKQRSGAGGPVIPTEGAYDPKKYQNLDVPPEMENIFQYIIKYTPQKIEIAPRLQPFVPEYVPAVGDTDAFIKVTTPACDLNNKTLEDSLLEHIDNLGLTVLDEPSAEQSESALLHLQLRAISKTNYPKSTVVTKKIDNAEKNPKAIERWIKDVSELHLTKPPPNFAYSAKMPDVDALMEEWPDAMERILNEVGVPPATLDCSLVEYVDLICGLFDIPIAADTLNDRIQALHMLFTLYIAVKNSQLYADRQKDERNEI
ncbi:Intraflagellar transport protein 46 homolog [Eumeta japonica]|uniref:Intraflagellar transport protein 46 homolog n=1 Tax=Eumeta variegata TaxID=151549 RepID=A0A4C1UE72_EUMVA|nr:Intraflagellar transport protein 46 homolog [Eumeta japonica]